MVPAWRLPLRFDADLLAEDVRRLRTHPEWLDHWGGGGRSGDWRVLELLVADDRRARSSVPGRDGSPIRPAGRLDDFPHLRAAVDAFRTRVIHARLSRLRAGASIREHRDYGYDSDQRWSFERGFIRVHVPIVAGDGVEWRLRGERIDMRPGEAWYLNVCLPHAVDNRGDVDRLHLVMEIEVNDWVRSLFPPETAWDRVRGALLRRLEPPVWTLVKPIVEWRRRRHSHARAA